MITLSLSEKEAELLKRTIIHGLEACKRDGLNLTCSGYTTLEKILHQLPNVPLVSDQQISFTETILEY